MTERDKIYDLLVAIVGEDACDDACGESELYQEDGEWKLFLCGFMEPWPVGKTLEEVEANLWKLAEPGFGHFSSS